MTAEIIAWVRNWAVLLPWQKLGQIATSMNALIKEESAAVHSGGTLIWYDAASNFNQTHATIYQIRTAQNCCASIFQKSNTIFFVNPVGNFNISVQILDEFLRKNIKVR